MAARSPAVPGRAPKTRERVDSQDILHMTPAGIKLKAWLVLQQIAPEIERRLDDGRLPLADPGGRTVHPAFAGSPPTLVRLADIRNTCTAPTVH